MIQYGVYYNIPTRKLMKLTTVAGRKTTVMREEL